MRGGFPRAMRRFLPAIFLWAASGIGTGWGQDSLPRLGILLDTSPEMGFLAVQARKEIRWNNTALASRGRQTQPVIEFAGASLEREGSLVVPARRNALFPLRELLDERKADGVCWITALRGQQSGDGFHAVTTLLSGGDERDSRPLVIRHVWQDQIQAAAEWTRHPPPDAEDALAPSNRPFDWYSLARAGGGVIIRSWQVPPLHEMAYFGFPQRIAGAPLLRQLNIADHTATMDGRWKQDLSSRLGGLVFAFTQDAWLPAVTGRRWLEESILVPHLDPESIEERNAAVFEALRARETIEEDLARIPARQLGVLFGFGHVERDLQRVLSARRPGNDWRSQYLADLTAIVRETREHLASQPAVHPGRVYATEHLRLPDPAWDPSRAGAYARRMARMAREDGVDAIYFFTNGYSGGDYGRFEVDLPLIAAAIREANVALYVRVPYELGVAPIALQRLAMASGGGIFLGRADDPDWSIAAPAPAWPDPPGES